MIHWYWLIPVAIVSFCLGLKFCDYLIYRAFARSLGW